MYVLVMTMIFKSGYGGMGGVNTHDFDNLKDCNMVGDAWVVQMKDRRMTGKNEAFYKCVKIGK